MNMNFFKKGSKYHTKNIEGEELPEKVQDKVNKPVLIASYVIGMLVLFLGTYLINFGRALLTAINESQKGISDLDFDTSFSVSYLKPIGSFSQYLIIAIVVVVGICFLLYSKLNHESEKTMIYGQRGDSHFLTVKELKQQYFEIPEKGKTFNGIGGIPVSHYKNSYFIDRDNCNTIIIGASRSGKGETFVLPFMDNLSRAKEKCSLIVNDPKGELFRASKETLEKRGYRVLVLNIDDPLQSMSYNPLQLVIDAWAQGDYEEATKRANTLTSMLFSQGMSADNDNAYFYRGAKSAINAIILTITEDCFKNNCIERITMYNVAQMLNELGVLYYTDEIGREVNALDEYFRQLPQGNQAKIQYGSTSFAGDKSKGSILSTASQGIEMFTSEFFGKLTSKSSIDLKEVGFPKFIRLKLSNSYVGKRVLIRFLRRNEKEVKVIHEYIVKVRALGMCEVNFDIDLQDNDYVEIRHQNGKTISRAWYSMTLPKDNSNEYDCRITTKKFKSGKLFSDLDVKNIEIHYANKPTAIFMVVPDYDVSNHVLCSIFVKQLHTELSANCKYVLGNKCTRRVQFLLDEFGNMPPLDQMGNILSVSLGRNMNFNLIVQSYSQINHLYGDVTNVIKENCQNHILILSNDDETVEEISKKCGHRTVIEKSASGKRLDTESTITDSVEQQRLITFERASQLIEGEQIILRPLHRRDNDSNKVRPFPIFNTKETNMPNRYQFLADYFDTTNDINEIDVNCEHTTMSLKDNLIDYSDYIYDIITKITYCLTNDIPIKIKDYEAYSNLKISRQTLNNEEIEKHLETIEMNKQDVEQAIHEAINNVISNKMELNKILFEQKEKIAKKYEEKITENIINFISDNLQKKDGFSNAYLCKNIDGLKKLEDTTNKMACATIPMPIRQKLIKLKESTERLINLVEILLKA